MGNSSILEKVPGAKGFLGFTHKTDALRYILGKQQSAKVDLAGNLAGVYDYMYKPKAVQPIPTDNVDAAAATEADRQRRLAKKAAGLDSTIRTSPSGAASLYSAQPKSLLGS